MLEGNQATVWDLAAIYLDPLLRFPVISVRKRLWFSQLLSAHLPLPQCSETLRGPQPLPSSADPRQSRRSGPSSGRQLPPELPVSIPTYLLTPHTLCSPPRPSPLAFRLG